MSAQLGAWAALSVMLLGAAAGCDQTFEFDSGSDDPCAYCGMLGLVCHTTWKVCVECNSSDDCHGDKPYCDTALNRCGACSPSSCGSREACDGWTHTCVRSCAPQTDRDQDCEGTDLTCSNNVCVVCLSDDDCRDSPSGSFCVADGVTCGACKINADCGSGRFCDPISFQCEACRDGRDCPPGLLCAPDTHECVDPDG